MILSALAILIRQAVLNERENRATSEIVSEMEKILPEGTVGSPEAHYGNSMPAAEINGENYVGLLVIPDYNAKYPVGASWENSRRNRYPCVYSGNLYDNSLIIGGINSAAQYNFASDIDIGAKIRITDLYGQVFMYEVMMVNHMNSESDITSQGEDFTFFVIANSSAEYIIIRCRLSEMS